MEDTKRTEVRTGVSFLSLLGLVFITLKLVGVIDWSWWIVLLPLWGQVALAIAIVLGVVTVSLIATCMGKKSPKK